MRCECIANADIVFPRAIIQKEHPAGNDELTSIFGTFLLIRTQMHSLKRVHFSANKCIPIQSIDYIRVPNYSLPVISIRVIEHSMNKTIDLGRQLKFMHKRYEWMKRTGKLCIWRCREQVFVFILFFFALLIDFQLMRNKLQQQYGFCFARNKRGRCQFDEIFIDWAYGKCVFPSNC